MRRAARRDSNHAQITHALEDVGYSVLDLSRVGAGCPDILVGGICRLTGRPMSWLMEIKTATGKVRPGQDAFRAAWRGPIAIVRTVDDAYRIVGVLSAPAAPAATPGRVSDRADGSVAPARSERRDG